MKTSTLVTQPDQLQELCARLRESVRIAFDTEFVPEYTFAPQLCLIQVATDELYAVIDPLAIDDVGPFWQAVMRPGCEIVVHAGKEEMNFCLTHTGQLPKRVIDIQLAGGMTGLGFPTSYSNLAQRLLNANPSSGETRTDWRKRPLSPRQVEYALDDVRYLLPMRDRLCEMLEAKGRVAWFEEETASILENQLHREDGERWRRLSGAGSLPSRGLAVLRELVAWRENRARQMDKPPRWVLRDDLLVELAKRQPTSLRELQSTRGIGNVGENRWAKDLIDSIVRGRALPEDECPKRIHKRETPDEQMIVKILSAAMIHLARNHQIAAGLLGSNEDLRQLMDWQAGGESLDNAPRLASGWRAQVCGNGLTDLLKGRTAVRIQNIAGSPQLIFDEHANGKP
ncbi:MAG: ribonuclease D [Planctomycetota bacterium]